MGNTLSLVNNERKMTVLVVPTAVKRKLIIPYKQESDILTSQQ